MHIKKINTQSDEDIGTKMTKIDIYGHIDKMNLNKNGNNDVGQNKKSILKKTNTLKNGNNTDLVYSDQKIGDIPSKNASSTK